MLVLQRKRWEKIIVGDDIEITVCEVRDGKVRLGFSAPRDVPIYRSELYRDMRLAKAAIEETTHGS